MFVIKCYRPIRETSISWFKSPLSSLHHEKKAYFQPQTTAEVMRRFCGGFLELVTRIQPGMRLNIVDCGQREANN